MSRDRVCVVTGATRGIGRATAIALAKLGEQVVVVGRDAARLDEVRREADRAAHADLSCVRADFASLASVRRAADEIAQRWPAIHVLVNNAGINAGRRQLSADGFELTFAVNHLAPFLLTSLLVPALAAGAPSRIVNVTSVFAHVGRIDVEDVMFERRRYSSTRAYNQSKLATAMFTMELANRLTRSGIGVNCVSPGLVATDLMREHWWFHPKWLRALWSRWLLSPEAAAARVVRVATSEALDGVSGKCFAATLRPVSLPRRARDAMRRRALWDLSATLTNAELATPASLANAPSGA
ncbi:MAG TPA: SDR family NAD(P)-dependent oxidoreductase [Gemmatimonadaceae bacterium]|nr:SDR family NAD(P)-dependent oxidoreductase [Gemmatimonadaceae bacterium]